MLSCFTWNEYSSWKFKFDLWILTEWCIKTNLFFLKKKSCYIRSWFKTYKNVTIKKSKYIYEILKSIPLKNIFLNKWLLYCKTILWKYDIGNKHIKIQNITPTHVAMTCSSIQLWMTYYYRYKILNFFIYFEFLNIL